MVVEKGLTIGGKPVIEHLEAIGHAAAFGYILELAQLKKIQLTLDDIVNIPSLMFAQTDKLNQEHIEKSWFRSSGLHLKLPEPVKITELMELFID